MDADTDAAATGLANLYRQGLILDFLKKPFRRRGQNFNPGRGRSLQTTEALTYKPATEIINKNHRYTAYRPIDTSKGKFLFSSREKDEEGLTRRERTRLYLQSLAEDDAHPGFLHGEDDPEEVKRLVSRTIRSNKPDHFVVARPLFSYTERNAGSKKCKYGAYKDGTRYRCIQNLNHKKGGGGEVRDYPSERQANGEPDERTQQQDRDVNEQPYQKKRRQNTTPTTTTTPRTNAPTVVPQTNITNTRAKTKPKAPTIVRKSPRIQALNKNKK